MTQITALVILALAFGFVLMTAVIVRLADRIPFFASPVETVETVRVVTALAKASRQNGELEAILSSARRAGIDVELVRASSANMPSEVMTGFLVERLRRRAKLDVLEYSERADGAYLMIGIGGEDALRFRTTLRAVVFPALTFPMLSGLSLIALLVAVLTGYAARWIVSPLSSFADAAHTFGRTAEIQSALPERGPREVAQVARALNEMRDRIGTLLRDRTRMLAAISHDLRTPLTRLRLRAERIVDASLRHAILGDIENIRAMLNGTLEYLRAEARSESFLPVDLGSVLQTIADQFSDMRYDVRYEGPARLACILRPNAMTRAITNIVENGLKAGSFVRISLAAQDDVLAVDITDDGPGIPADLRDKVFEPFFKCDTARSAASNEGFGLGLSIAREIVRTHDGTIELGDASPHGLLVRICIPEHRPSEVASFPRPERASAKRARAPGRMPLT
jgi:signal transduction histidine kinase